MLEKLENAGKSGGSFVSTPKQHSFFEDRLNLEEIREFNKEISNSSEFNILITKYMSFYVDVVELNSVINEKIGNSEEIIQKTESEMNNESNLNESNKYGNDKKSEEEDKSKIEEPLSTENKENVIDFKLKEGINKSFLKKKDIFIENYINISKQISTNNEEINNKIETFFSDLSDINIKLDNLDIKNEIGSSSGPYGWCVNCRNPSIYFSDKILFPLCSSECEIKMMGLGKLIEIDNIIETGSLKDDFINTFKVLSKLSVKDIKSTAYLEQINQKLREFSLEILQTLINRGGKYFSSDYKLIQVIKEFTIESLVKNSLSNEMNIFRLSVNMFYSILPFFRENLKDQIEIYINSVLISILESENFGFFYKEIIIDSLIKFNENVSFLVEIHSNYDCEINHNYVFTELVNILSRIIQGQYRKSKYANTFKLNQEYTLRIKCLNFLSGFIKNLEKFVDENIKASNQILGKNEMEYNEDEMNSTLLDYEIKDKINQNRKIKMIISKGVDKFNLKPSKGIQYFIGYGILPSEDVFNTIKNKLIALGPKGVEEARDLNDQMKKDNLNIISDYLSSYDYSSIISSDYDEFLSKEIAKFLKQNKELKKQKIGEYLCESKKLNQLCMKNYIEIYNFKGLHILDAMRLFFSDFYLLGESQVIDRIMQKFGEKYHRDNPTLFNNPDIGYYLSFSIIMLQTDLHRAEVINKMNPQTFASRVMELTNNELNHSFLIDIYKKIQEEPIKVTNVTGDIIRRKKSKRTIIDTEKQNILKSTIDQLKSKTFKSTIFNISVDNDHAKLLLESSWSSFLGIYSLLLTEMEEDEIVLTCIHSILSLAKMCGMLGLETSSEAFLNSIIRMTNIMEGKEIKQKNIDCTRFLLEFAIHNGNYANMCWFNILTIISNIDYYHTIGGQYKNEAELFSKEIRRRSKIKNPDKEIEIELKNTDFICRTISMIMCENVFSRTIHFSEEGITKFVSALCQVSKNELSQFFNPRNYSLHKLIEVADFNIFRIQIEWTKIWRLISEHIVYVANNYSHDNICVDAIDSLRQIVIKLLQKPDLAIYNFQIDFFKPFENIFIHSVNRPDRSEIILTYISYITVNSKNIHSGWIVIFNIIKEALKRKDGKILNEVINIVQNINEETSIINCVSQEVFRGYIECLCHVYLEPSTKKLAFDLILKFISKIFAKFFLKNGENKINKVTNESNFNSYIYLKNFFHGFDDLIKFNVIEHINLIFEVITFNKDFIFSTDVNNFIYLYYSYFKPQIVISIMFNFSNVFNQIKSSFKITIDEDSNPQFTDVRFDLVKIYEVINEFVPKIKNEDVFFNSKYFLKKTLEQLMHSLQGNEEKSENELAKNNDGFNKRLCDESNFFEISNNGGVENKKEIVNFLSNIATIYEKDMELILKKIEVFSKLSVRDYEGYLDIFLEKFLEMVQKNSDSLLNYKFFYEDFLLTMLNLSIFNSNSEIIFKLIGKHIFSFSNNLSNNFWQRMNLLNIFLLYSFSNIPTTFTEEELNEVLKFLKFYFKFFLDLIINCFSEITNPEHYNSNYVTNDRSVLGEIGSFLNKIVYNIMKLETENSYKNYRLIDDGNTIEILKAMMKIKFIIIEKTNEAKDVFDEKMIESIETYNKVFKKYKLSEQENNEFIDVIVFEFDFILPKCMKLMVPKQVESLFFSVIDFIDSRNSHLRFCVKNIMKQIVENRLISFNQINK